jgi:hypothetical protein
LFDPNGNVLPGVKAFSDAASGRKAMKKAE